MDDTSPLESELIDVLRGLDDGKGLFLDELITLFEQDSKPVADRLIAALRDGSIDTAKRLAHKLKGMGANLGAQRLGLLLETIEFSYENLSATSKLALPDQIVDELRQVLEALQKERRSGPKPKPSLRCVG